MIKRHSVSKQMFERFAKNRKRRSVSAYLYVVFYLTYLAWRWTILNHDSMALSLLYFTAECFGFVLGLTIITASRNYNHRDPLPPMAGRNVDIFVPAYKEPIELIRRTLIAAKEIDYPHQTWLLDDGRREEMRQMAADLDIHYLSRPENTHAKAGNLNYGLAHSKAEFVMVFDADHIALPHALDITLGFFADEEVAMVQTPQDYYNTDAFQYINTRSGGLWHDQSFFYNIGLSCRDSVNGTSCVGTGAVYRRSALDKIGGIPTATVTEDIHTSLKFHKAGYKIAYLNEPIAYGEAAPDLREYYKTRQRWGHGNLHALQNENVLFCKGLTLRQRWAHLSLGLIYLEGWQQLMIFMIPIATLMLGWQPFEISIFNILIVLLFPILNYALLQEVGCGFARFWPNEIFAMARWPVHILATAGCFGRTMPWRTSLKHFKPRVHWDLMLPQLTVMCASLAALGYAISKVGHDFETGPLFSAIYGLSTAGSVPASVDIFAPMDHGYTVDLVIISGFWAFYNALRATCFAVKVIRNANASHVFYRFRLPLPLRLKNGSYGRVKRISETWCGFTLFDNATEHSVGDIIPVTLYLPAGPIELRLTIEALKKGKNSKFLQAEGSFVWSVSPEKRDQLARSLYSVDWHREFLNRQAYFKTPMDVINSCLTLKSLAHEPASSHTWDPILFWTENTDHPVYGIMATDSDLPDMGSFITFTSLPPHTQIDALQLTQNGPINTKFSIVHEDFVSSLVQKGLDKAIVRRYRIQLSTVTQKSRFSINRLITTENEAIIVAI